MSMEFKVDVEGFDFAKLSARKALESSLKKCAYDLQEESTKQAPILWGDLRDSAQTTFNSGAKDYEAIVSFNTIYALRQHEHPEYKHPKGGKAKYLEDPFKQNQAKYMNFIQNAIKAVLK